MLHCLQRRVSTLPAITPVPKYQLLVGHSVCSDYTAINTVFGTSPTITLISRCLLISGTKCYIIMNTMLTTLEGYTSIIVLAINRWILYVPSLPQLKHNIQHHPFYSHICHLLIQVLKIKNLNSWVYTALPNPPPHIC